MRRLFHIVFGVMLLAAVACNSKPLEIAPEQEFITTDSGEVINEAALMPDRIRIYVTEETAQEIEADSEAYISNHPEAGIISIRRTFPDAGEFEERSRSKGLHLWYDVTLSGERPLTKAGGAIKAVDGVTLIDYIPRIKRPQYQDVSWKMASEEAYASLQQAKPAATSSRYFNDPAFKEQWHFYNRGLRSAVDGCDINILPVWKGYKCGDENVIVAVVDGGIDYNHLDLADNMWHNPEQSGNKIYGYNFLNDSYVITAEDHGTHVAGIIAAINNNKTGGCGIAGGDAELGVPGVRLLSCQIFKQGSDDSGDDIRAIKWAADHGAVICQNSWAYDDAKFMPLATKQAIDYFNEFAGTDKNGHQTGPMMGGLVVFAASNEGVSSKIYPPCYEGVIAVSALGADYRLASYSNYGDWVDIAAPGGEDDYYIYSTISNNRYALYSGTSMSSPHVSGVAALIVANFGGDGFTRDDLINILLHHTTDISGDNPAKYPGVGLLNAHAAIAANTSDPAFTISDLSVRAQGRRIKANVDVTDPAEEASWISGARIYYSTEPFSDIDGIPFCTTYIRATSSAAPFSLESANLEYSTRYYTAVALTDEFGNCTPPSDVREIVTVADAPPTIVPATDIGSLIVHSHENVVLEYEVSDPWGDEVEVQLTTDYADVVKMEYTGTTAKVTIRGYAAKAGDYSFTITATDTQGLQAGYTLPFTVATNTPPEIINTIDDIIIPGGETVTLELGNYFYDADKENLSYTFTADDPNLINTRLGDNKVTLIPQHYGQTTVTVKATDFHGESATLSFSIMVRNQNIAVELYPNPTTDGKLYLRVGITREVEVKVVNPAGATIYDQRLTIEPFSPAVIDLGGYSAGSYLVTTSTGGETTTRRVVKL